MVLLSAVGALLAQDPASKLVINTNTPEGKVLQQIGQEADGAKKQQLCEEFLAKYPKDEGVLWVYEQVQPVYLKQNAYDKVIEAGGKALAINPDDLEVSYNNLKAAEGKRDAAGVKKWSGETSRIARKVVASSSAGGDDAKQRADYAKQVDTYTEYSLYATALQTTDPHTYVDLYDTLAERNARSAYLKQLNERYLASIMQTGDAAKATAMAEKMLVADPQSEDALAYLANRASQQKESAKALQYAAKLTETLGSNRKPEGVDDAAWQRKKETLLGVGYYLQGTIYGQENKYAQADKALRAGLPYMKDPQMTAIASFILGLSDYKLAQGGRSRELMRDALKYSEQSAAMRSPVQGQAAANVKAIKAALRIR